jgi:hypothetical protein
LNILKWTRTNGCSWDEEPCFLTTSGGHFKTLKWAIENNYPWNKTTCGYVANKGHFEAPTRNIKMGQRKNDYTDNNRARLEAAKR